MIKAVVQNGVLVPREPLPADWHEGTEVEVERTATFDVTTHPADSWMDEVEKMAAKGSLEDDQRLDAAIRELRRRQKPQEPDELDEVCDENPIYFEGVRLSRDELHSRSKSP